MDEPRIYPPIYPHHPNTSPGGVHHHTFPAGVAEIDNTTANAPIMPSDSNFKWNAWGIHETGFLAEPVANPIGPNIHNIPIDPRILTNITLSETAMATGYPPVSRNLLVGYSAFDHRVFALVSQIPFGWIASSAELARLLGSNTASVGRSIGKATHDPAHPTHRVVHHDKIRNKLSLRVSTDRPLLAAEGIGMDPSGRILATEYGEIGGWEYVFHNFVLPSEDPSSKKRKRAGKLTDGEEGDSEKGKGDLDEKRVKLGEEEGGADDGMGPQMEDEMTADKEEGGQIINPHRLEATGGQEIAIKVEDLEKHNDHEGIASQQGGDEDVKEGLELYQWLLAN